MSAPEIDVPIEAARRNVDRLGIRYDQLPQQPSWAPFIGRTESYFKIRVTAKVMAGSAMTGRRLTQPETDALAQHYAKLLATQAYGTPVALCSAVGIWYATIESYGFPFWRPNPDKFNPNKFFMLPEGPLSQRAWHALRLSAWYLGCRVASGLFITSYAISVYMKGYGSDPRLQDYREAVKTRMTERHRAAMGQSAHLPPSGFGDGQPPSSPSAGTGQSPQDDQSSWPGMQSPQPSSPQPSFSDESYVFDDASPVTPSEQRGGTRQQSTQGGSAWDRIRGQARAGQGQQGQASGGQAEAWRQKRQDELASRGAQDGSSYSFSSGDEEKAYAKEQAQKEFDEMLERERRGQGDSRSRW